MDAQIRTLFFVQCDNVAAGAQKKREKKPEPVSSPNALSLRESGKISVM